MTTWAEPRHPELTPVQGARPDADARAVCAILRAETRPGADAEFAILLNDLADNVRTGEPGCNSYVATRVMGSRAHFAVHARFSDWDAFERHADTEHFQRLMPRLTALLAAPVSMELFLEV